MASGRSPLKQIALPFVEGEASHADRWNDLGIALLRIPPKQCTAQLAGLVRWIFNVTKGGVEGALIKSFAELAQRPWGLCCDERTARRTVANARRYGLIRIEEQRRWDGSQQPNAYAIDWEGVTALKLGQRTDGLCALGGGHKVLPPGHTVPLGGHKVRHTKEFSHLQSSTVKNSGTGPETAPNPEVLILEGNGSRTDDHSLTSALLAGSPILAEASGRRIAPLPAGELCHGVYAVITDDDLHKPCTRFVPWHRRQLSTAVPVMGDKEADLLLTLATALYANSIPRKDLLKNHVAVFVGTISQRRFTKSLPFVPQARTLLDKGIERFGSAWAGLSDEPEGQPIVEHEEATL